jgi:hypothetical protein
MREPLALSVIPELRVSAISGTQGQRMARVEHMALAPARACPMSAGCDASRAAVRMAP